MGLLAAKLCWIRGAGRVIVIDAVDYRLKFAEQQVGLCHSGQTTHAYITVVQLAFYYGHSSWIVS